MNQEELEKELKARIEARMAEVGAWKKGKKGVTFAEIETKVLAVGREIMRDLMEVMVEDEREEERRGRRKPEPECEGCGRPMSYKGTKGKGVLSQVGEIEIERDHYHCPDCQVGIFPPGSGFGDRAGELE
jgi:hypothetical protein